MTVARSTAPNVAAFGAALVAHGLVAVALNSYGHNQRVADVLVVVAAAAVGLGLWATRRPVGSLPGAAALAWLAALASTIAALVP